jgi:hypothetical protein
MSDPGGVFVIDVLGKERLARRWLNAMYSKLEDGSLLFQRPEVYADWTRIRNEWILIKTAVPNRLHLSIRFTRDANSRIS